MGVGQLLYITGGGYYTITTIDPDGTTITLTNPGYPNNTPPGQTITDPANVSPAGIQGPPGTPGTNGTGGNPGTTTTATPGPKLTGTGSGWFGNSVAISADGNTAIIGGNGTSSYTGAAWVYTLQNGIWTQQGDKLTPNDPIGASAYFGQSVTLSADGNTALIGGNGDNSGQGAAWLFTRTGTGASATWTQDSKLTDDGTAGTGQGFGWSVALSSDGATALIGSPGDNSNAGAVWVFTHTGATWAQTNLTPSDPAGASHFGSSVALSTDGTTALIGGNYDDNSAGAAWVYTLTAGDWTQQTKLTGTGEIGAGEFGNSVALSADGNTALIGAYGDNAVGAVWVYTRSGGVWTQQGSKLTGAGATATAGFGAEIALSSDGNTALIGGYGDNSMLGAAWVFTRSGGVWTAQGSKLTGPGETGAGKFGYSVSLSWDGNTALIGGVYDNGTVGAAWVFGRSASSTWIAQGSKLTGPGEVGLGYYGAYVQLSDDGYTALIGGYTDNGQLGAAWVRFLQ
jgi:hypothetical protein